MLCTRPYLAYAIQQLSQFNSNPTNMHFQAVKRVLPYFQGSQIGGLVYKHNREITIQMQAYCDVDYVADSDRKSIFGYVFLLATAAISWQIFITPSSPRAPPPNPPEWKMRFDNGTVFEAVQPVSRLIFFLQSK